MPGIQYIHKFQKYRELVWVLAVTDFKLRYQNSILGYFWALLKPFALFSVLNFVFSSVFSGRGLGQEYYTLELITALMMFMFFSDGTSSGLQSLVSKSQLVTKIYVPRWTIIFASTINATLIYCMNLIVVVGFFLWYGLYPSIASILFFIVNSVVIYILILSFALLFSPLFVKLRDLSMVWEVIVRVLFYATPIIYPLRILPDYIQQVILMNPMAFIIHFTKESLVRGRFPEIWQFSLFLLLIVVVFLCSLMAYKKTTKSVAENM
jgi:lipopolysaccharide transport system permease protein